LKRDDQNFYTLLEGGRVESYASILGKGNALLGREKRSKYYMIIFLPLAGNRFLT